MQATNYDCDVCHKEIKFGSPYIAICFNIENMEREYLNQQDYVNVITSDQIFTMCGKCGNKRNAEQTTSLLSNGFKVDHPRLN